MTDLKLDPETKFYVGKRGGIYYLRNGKKIYLPGGRKAVGYRKKRKVVYTPPRGSFGRYLDSTTP